MHDSGARLSVQRVLDSAFAWSVMNRHFDVADFLLRARRRYQHHVELPRAGEHPARAGLSCELRIDAVPHRPRHRHDHRGLPLERHGTGLGVVRREGREDGSVAARCRTAAGPVQAAAVRCASKLTARSVRPIDSRAIDRRADPTPSRSAPGQSPPAFPRPRHACRLFRVPSRTSPSDRCAPS